MVPGDLREKRGVGQTGHTPQLISHDHSLQLIFEGLKERPTREMYPNHEKNSIMCMELIKPQLIV